MSTAEVTGDFSAVLERLRRGEEVVVEQDHQPVAVIKAFKGRGRLLSESLARAEAHASAATLDDRFSADLEDIIGSHREPLDASRWD